MERLSADRRWRLGVSLVVLGVVAFGLYGATLWRFGVIMAGG